MREKFWETFLSPIDALILNSVEVPEKTAYIFLEQGEQEKDSVIYRDFEYAVRKVAAFLQKHYSPGDRALLLYPSGVEFFIAFYGCLFAGIIPIPANPPKINRSVDRLLAIVNDARARLALATDDFLVDLPKRIEQIPQMEEITFLNHADLVTEGAAEEWQKLEVGQDDIAFIQYTSGSTQTPKGVQITFGNIYANCRMINEIRKAEPDNLDQRAAVSWLPIFHDMGLITSMFQFVYDRTLCVLMTPVAFLQKPIRWLKAISKYRATATGAPNFAYELCVNQIDQEDLNGLDLSSWKVGYNSSEPVRLETMNKFVNKFGPCGFEYSTFVPCFGLAEATLMMTYYQSQSGPSDFFALRSGLEDGLAEPASAEDPSAISIANCGNPVLDGVVKIVDQETLEECDDSKVGEIWLSGSNISPGYWNRPDETRESFKAEIAGKEGTYLRTGDLGFVKDGQLFVTGRLKDLLIVRGRNYYPQDIEVTTWKCHPSLREEACVAFGFEVDGAEKLGVVQEVRRTHRKSIDVEEALKQIRFSIAREQGLRAHAVLLIQPYSLPKTSSGKLMRSATKRMFFDDEFKVIGEWRSPDI